MTATIILNVVLSIFVVVGIVALLGLGIAGERISLDGLRARRALAARQRSVRSARAPRRSGRPAAYSA